MEAVDIIRKIVSEEKELIVSEGTIERVNKVQSLARVRLFGSSSSLEAVPLAKHLANQVEVGDWCLVLFTRRRPYVIALFEPGFSSSKALEV